MGKRETDRTPAIAAGVAGSAAAGLAAFVGWRDTKLRELVDGKSVRFEKFDPLKISADPDTFQFKGGGDAAGVTDRLRGVSKWDPVAAGKAVVYERADGTRVIADGHQRLGLAKRVAASGDQVRLDGYLFRERDGWTPKDVRAYAALKNIKELSGAALDMAKVIRERPDLLDKSVPMSDAKIKEAMSLSRLSKQAFNMVVGGVIRPELAAAIGDQVKDAGRHAGLIGELVKSDINTIQQARLYVGQALAAPTIAQETASLFGKETETRSLIKERTAVLDKALAVLKSDRKVFATLEREASRIEDAGNKLARSSNAARAESAGQLNTLVEKLATKAGPVSSMLDDAARQVAAGDSSATAARKFVAGLTERARGAGGLQALVSGEAPPAAAKPAPKGQTSFLAEATTSEKIAAESRAIAAKGRVGDPMHDGLFSSASKQADLVDQAKAAKPTASVEERLRGLKKPELRAIARDLGARFDSRSTNSALRNAITLEITASSRQAQRRVQTAEIFGNQVDQAKVSSAGAGARADMTARVHAAIDKVAGKGPAGWSDAAREASAKARSPRTRAITAENFYPKSMTAVGSRFKGREGPTPTKPKSGGRAPKSNPALVAELAGKAKAALQERVDGDDAKAVNKNVSRLHSVVKEIEQAKLSKADKLALAREVGIKNLPASASGARAIKEVSGRLRSSAHSRSRLPHIGGIFAIGGPIVAAAVAYDSTKSQALAAGKDNAAATTDASINAAVAGGAVAGVGYGISKGIAAASKVAPIAGKVLARAVPVVAVGFAGYEAYKGYQKDGLAGAGDALLDFASLGAYSHFGAKEAVHAALTPNMQRSGGRNAPRGRAYLNDAAARKAATAQRIGVAVQQTAATPKSSNGWVAGYMRSDGVRVAGYRRK